MKNLLSISLLFICTWAFGQDKIYKTNDEVVECKVIEVGADVISYKQNDSKDAATITIDKIDVIKIVFSDGTIMQIKPEDQNEDLYVKNNTSAWKFDFLSPLFGHTAIGYEKSIEPGMSHEGFVGFIGLGSQAGTGNSNPRGLYAKYGIKFIKPRTSFFAKSNGRFSHLLDGSYIKPEVHFGYFRQTLTYSAIQNSNQFPPQVDYGTVGSSSWYGGLQIVVGKQKVYNNKFSFDYYGGIGYGFESSSYDLRPNATVQEGIFRKSFGVVGNYGPFPLVASAGVRIGFLSK